MSLLNDHSAGPVLSLLSVQNIESKLSYAYLHAVAAQAGVSCTQGSRHEDNHGIDAKLLGLAPFPAQGKRTEVDINIQLKTTVKEPALIDESFAYSLNGISRYDQLRSMTRSIPRILVVLFMPAQSAHWITHTEDALALHKCAYWVSLRNAPASSNMVTQTVYLPQTQRFDADGLRRLMGSISRGEVPEYQGRKIGCREGDTMSPTRAAIAPVDLRDFLQSEGWTPLEPALADRLYVLNNARFPQRQLIFPIDRAASDYEESVELVIDKFSQLSGQPPSALFSTIASLRDDVIRLRVSSGDNDDALPLKFASTFIKNTQKLLKTAACAAVSPHLHHPRLSINEATTFIENARFDQTERSSFILHVSCPLNGMDKPKKTALTNDDTPFVRKVTLNLQASLNRPRFTRHFLAYKFRPSRGCHECEAIYRGISN